MQNIPKSGGLTVYRDGFTNLVGGMDSSRHPDLIDPDKCGLAVNISFRGGKPKTRPCFKEISLGDPETWASVSTLRDGLFQGGICYYSTTVGRSLLIGCYSGWILVVDPILGTTTVLNPLDRNDRERKTYMLQAENYLIIQNGVDIPLIWDGVASTTRRSKTGANNGVLGSHNVSITNASGVATVVTFSAHGLTTGDYIELDGIEIAGYVGQFYATVVNSTTFTVGVSSTLANPVYPGTVRYCPEIPTGLLMAYGQGRIFVTSANRVEFTAGDIIYGDLNGSVGNILNWTENQYLAEGLSFRLPTSQGRITTMVFPAFQDTQAGQGELFVFGEYGASSFAVSNPRTSTTDPITGAVTATGWRDLQIQKIVLIGTGCTSQWSCVNFTNGDLFYRDAIGIRSYRNARGDMQSYGKTAMSAEVSAILDNDEKTALVNVSGAHIDNRFLMTCTPIFAQRKVRIVSIVRVGKVVTITTADNHDITAGSTFTVGGSAAGKFIPGVPASGYDGDWVAETVTGTTITFTTSYTPDATVDYSTYLTSAQTGTEIYHRGLLALDFNSTSTVGAKSYAAWDGLWTGLQVQQLVSGYFDSQERCFVFAYGGVGDNQIWEITGEYGDDISLDGPSKIACAIETRAYNFQLDYNKKKLRRLDTFLSDIRGEVNFAFAYRWDASTCWNSWDPGWKRCATVSSPVLPDTNSNSDGLAQNFPQVRTQITQPTPANVCESVQGGLTSIGFEVQVRATWTGNCTIEKMVLSVDDIVENPRATCPAGATA